MDELREQGGVGVEAEAEEQGDGGEGELAEDGGGEGDGLAAKAEAGLDELFPGVDVVLVLAGEELAHLGVDTIDVSGEGEDGEEDGEGEEVRETHWGVLRCALSVLSLGAGFRVRVMSVGGRRSSVRSSDSRADISPWSVSWSRPARWRRP